MEDKKPVRPVSEIQNEYSGLCMKAGHIQYQMDTLRKDLEAINVALRDLNLEAAASKAAEGKAEQVPQPAGGEEAK